MVQAFTTVLSMSKTAGIVILVVLLARLLLRRAPRLLSYLLWSVVLFRLLCPVSFSSPFYGLPEQAHTPVLSVAQPAPVPEAPNLGPAEEPPAAREETRPILPALAGLWAVGMAGMLVYAGFSYAKLKRQLVGSVRLRENIYQADYLETPFVMGFLHPKIYLPSTLEERELPYILAHERHHIRRLDHLLKPIAFLALCLHWFNPLVWLAFALFCKDMEMSCDEAVIRQLGEGVRAEYSATLLSLAAGRRVFPGAPLAFGEGDPKSRIQNLKNWKKPVLWVVIAAAVICAVLAVFLLTDHTEPSQTPNSQSVPASGTASPEQAVDALVESIRYEEGALRFTLPKEYPNPEDWSLQISGRAEYPDGMSMSLHYLEGTVWEAGKDYSIELGETADAQLELWMFLTLKDIQREIDLTQYLPAPEPLALTEQTANACMVQILETFVLEEDGTVSFSIPQQLPQSDETNIRLKINLYGQFRTDPGSSTAQDLLEDAMDWQGGEHYTSKLDLSLGELKRVFLRVSFTKLFEDGGRQDVYPPRYVELLSPFAFGQPAQPAKDSLSATQSGKQLTLDLSFANAPAAQLTLTLPEGVLLGQPYEEPDRSGYSLLAEDGSEAGDLFFMGLAAEKEDLQKVDTSKNQLPMQVYAGVALPNHIQYEDYQVESFGPSFAAATVQVTSQDLSLLDSEYTAAAEIPFANPQNVVLFYDYEKLPVFLQLSLKPELADQESCAKIAKSISLSQKG